MRSVRCLAAAEHPPNKDAGPRKGMEHTGIDMVHKPSADPQGNRYLGHDSQPPRLVSGFLPGQAEAQPPQIGPRKQRPNERAKPRLSIMSPPGGRSMT
jgi:hypothetical protein